MGFQIYFTADIMNVKGKIAIITGSGQGLGKAFANGLLQLGAKVCLSDVREETGAATLQEFQTKYGKENVHFISCDVTKRADLVALYDGCEKQFGGAVDIFCNNAGINHLPGWRKCMDIDIMAVMEGTELALERMSLDKGGRGGLIVNTASLAGIVASTEAEAACYFIAKHGVVQLTRALSTKKEFNRTGVKVQCICPSFADTAIVSELGEGTKERIKEKMGIMKVDVVADAFVKLVTTGGNGEALCILKDCPPFSFPDITILMVYAIAYGGLLLNKVLGVEVVRGHHQLLLLLTVVVLLHLLVGYLLF